MKIGLALSGGGILGMAHIGILKELEKNNIKIDIIAGTSVGALAGALYAYGGLDLLEKFIAHIEVRRRGGKRLLSDILGSTFSDIVKEGLDKYLKDAKFSDLKVKFFCTATDLSTGNLAVFDKGLLAPAILASCAYPGILPVQKIDGNYYIDGGIVCNLPASILRKKGADFIIGSSLSTVETIPEKKIDEIKNKRGELSFRALNIIFSVIARNEHANCDFCFKYPLGRYKWLNLDHMTPARQASEIYLKKNFSRLIALLRKKQLSA